MAQYLFSTSTYTERREALMKLCPNGMLLFLGNDYLPKNYKGNDFPFRQDSHFLYFFGLNQAKIAATIEPASGQVILYGDELSMDDIVWEGAKPSLHVLAEQVGITTVRPLKELRTALQAAKEEVRFLPPYQAEHKLFLAESLSRNPRELKASTALIQAVVQLRSYKSREEADEIGRTLSITDAMHRAAMQKTRAGIKESELVGVLTGIAESLGAGLAYPAIVTKNGQVLHNHDHHHVLEEGQLVLGDFGAESLYGYASDITRTWPVSRRFTDRQRAIYEIVLQAENEAINSLKPGLAYRDVHLNAATIIASGLKDLGLMKGDVSEAVAAGAHALFFPHGLGHMMGLDVHDMEGLGEDYVGYDDTYQRSDQFGLAYLRLGRALEPGFVLTVEPGIYFIPELIQQWQQEKRHESFINYPALKHWLTFGGIRIEDNILITDDGHEVLGPAIPKSVAEVEALRNEA